MLLLRLSRKKQIQLRRLDEFVHSTLDTKIADGVGPIRDIVVASQKAAPFQLGKPKADIRTDSVAAMVSIEIAEVERLVRDKVSGFL